MLLEAALFDPKAVRLASQKHNLRSESSARFEEACFQTTIVQAGKRAAELISNLVGTVKRHLLQHKVMT